MPVDTTHKEYDNALPDWHLCDDLDLGERRIKEQSTLYLPQLTGQTQLQYDSYKMRGEFFNAFGRTLKGYVGSVFRKDPVWVVPKQMEDYTNEITNSGLTLIDLAQEVVQIVLKKGRCGLLVDKDLSGESNPYITVCDPESIINWNSTFRKGKEVLSLLVLKEIIHEPDPKDEYNLIEIIQIRIFKLDEDGKCTFELYQKGRENKDYVLVNEPITLDIQGSPIDYIPFVFIGSEQNTSKVDPPPLIDLAYINISHWRKSVDMNHGLHFTALPTPYAVGFPENEIYSIGPQKVWFSTDPQAKAGFVEFSGQGLDSYAAALERDERYMAVLGARIIEKTRDKIETAETARLRQAGETSTLIKVVRGISRGITAALELVALWEVLPTDDIHFELNTDFVSAQLESQKIIALLQAKQAGEISQQTFLYQMVEGEITPPNVSIEEEKDLIEAEGNEEFEGAGSEGVEVIEEEEQPSVQDDSGYGDESQSDINV